MIAHKPDHRPRPYSRLENDEELRTRMRALGELVPSWWCGAYLDEQAEKLLAMARKIVVVAQ